MNMARYMGKEERDLPAGGVFRAVNMNAYHYAANNPLKYSDPSGEYNLGVGFSLSAGFGIGSSYSAAFIVGATWENGPEIGLSVTKSYGLQSPNISATIDLISINGEMSQINGSGKQESLYIGSFGGGLSYSMEGEHQGNFLSLGLRAKGDIAGYQGMETKSTTITVTSLVNATLDGIDKMKEKGSNMIRSFEKAYNNLENNIYSMASSHLFN